MLAASSVERKTLELRLAHHLLIVYIGLRPAPEDDSTFATWFTGTIGKSTSRQVFGRAGSLKSTASMAKGRAAPTARAISSARSFFVPFLLFFAIAFLFVALRVAPDTGYGTGTHSFREISMKGDATSSRES